MQKASGSTSDFLEKQSFLDRCEKYTDYFFDNGLIFWNLSIFNPLESWILCVKRASSSWPAPYSWFSLPKRDRYWLVVEKKVWRVLCSAYLAYHYLVSDLATLRGLSFYRNILPWVLWIAMAVETWSRTIHNNVTRRFMTNIWNKYNNDRIRMTSYQKLTEIPITSSSVGFLCYANCCRIQTFTYKRLNCQSKRKCLFRSAF